MSTDNTITEEEVSAWMKSQLEKAHKLSNYAHVTLSINQEKDFADRAKVRFSIFLGADYGPAVEAWSIDDCFDNLATPQARAEKLRADAAELLKRADGLDAFTQS